LIDLLAKAPSGGDFGTKSGVKTLTDGGMGNDCVSIAQETRLRKEFTGSFSDETL
jgi:hypothetical protein